MSTKSAEPDFYAFHDEVAGFVSTHLLLPAELCAMANRHKDMQRTLATWITHIEDARTLCALCETMFTRDVQPTLWAIVKPARSDASRVILQGICRDCCRAHYESGTSLLASIVNLFRKSLWPDLRIFTPDEFVDLAGPVKVTIDLTRQHQ